MVLLTFFVDPESIEAIYQQLVLKRFVEIACTDDLSHYVLSIRVAVLPCLEKMPESSQTYSFVPRCGIF